MEVIKDVFVPEDKAKYILAIRVLRKNTTVKEEIIEHFLSDKILELKQVQLDAIAQEVFTESGLHQEENVFGFDYKILEV